MDTGGSLMPQCPFACVAASGCLKAATRIYENCETHPMVKSKDESEVGPAPNFPAVSGTDEQARIPGTRTTATTLGRAPERSHPTPPVTGQSQSSSKEILRLQNASITDLREHDLAFANISRRLAESVVKRVNDSYHRAFTVPGAGFPRTESPYQFRTLEISEPANKHVKFRKSGVDEIHIKGLPVLCFKTDHRINCLEQPKAIRITQHGRALTATLVYAFPNYSPSPSPTPYQSCGIDPGVVQRLTVVNDQHQYQQMAGIDASHHRKTVR